MANSNATQIQINLQDNLNLNTNKSEISNFAGFNRRNSPFFNGGVSPLFTQEKNGSVIDKDGNVYKCENGNFYKNDEVLCNNMMSYEFAREEFSLPDSDTWCLDKFGQICYAKEYKIYYGDLVIEFHHQESEIHIPFDVIQISYIKELDLIVGISNWEVALIPVVENPTTSSSFRKYAWLNENEPKFYKLGYCETSVTIDGTTYNSVPQVRIQPAPKGLNRGDIEIPSAQEILILIADAPHNSKDLIYKGVFSDSTKKFYITPDTEKLMNAGVKSSDSPFYGCYKFNISITGTTMTIASSGDTSVLYSPTRLSDDFIDEDTRILSDGTVLFFNTIISNGTTKKTTFNMDFTLSVYQGFWRGNGCNAPDEEGHYTSFSLDRKINNVLYNNNKPSGVGSSQDILLSPFLDVESTNKIIPYRINYKNNLWGCVYKSVSEQKIIVVYQKPQTKFSMKLIEDRFVAINIADYVNGYDIKTGNLIHLFSDFNNRFIVGGGSFSADPVFNQTIEIAACQNGNYELLLNPNISAIFNPRIKYLTYVVDNDFIQNAVIVDTAFSGSINVQHNEKAETFYDVYINDSEPLLTPKYLESITLPRLPNYGIKKTIRQSLMGASYPVSTDGNIIFSPSVFSKFFDSQIGSDYIKDGRYYNLIYYEGLPLLAYYYGSGVANSEARFVIQGQSFVIRNGLIYSTSYSDGLMYVNDAVVNVDDLQFIGCVPMAAFFFSPSTKCVLAFTGDRNLQTSFEAIEMGSVINYKYVANNNSLYLATPDAVYVLYNTADGASYIYKIELANVTDFVAMNDGSVALKVGETWNIMNFFEKEGFERIPVKLTTAFYGAGLNRVSIIDCWYIRLFSNKSESGKVKVKVETLTNMSVTSEEQEFQISKDKWDENNGIVYLRYQPKLQRSVGCSLSIESDFAIYDLQASIKSDSAIQITKENGI